METKKASRMKTSTRAFLIALVLLLVCSVVNWGVVTGWDDVKITRITLIGDNGYEYSALMYVPSNATNETPAPGVMMFHGQSGNARNHESWAVEFTRRGFVVLSVDNMGAGNSEYSDTIGRYADPDLFTDYFLGLPIVDNTRWAAGGHSAGGNVTAVIAMKYQPNVVLFSNGGAKTFLQEEGNYGGNFLIINGTADKLNENAAFRKQVSEIFTKTGVFAEGEEVVPGKLYSSFEAGNASMFVEIEDQIHEAAFTNQEHIGHLLDFTQKAFEVPNYIEADNQVWMWKDAVGLIGMLVFAATMVLFAVMLVDEVPAFAIIKQPLPRNIGMRGKEMAISIAAALLFPLLCLYTGSFGLVQLLGAYKAGVPFLPLLFTNYGFATVLTLNVFGFIMFLLFHKTWGKKKYNATIRDYGLTVEGSTKVNWTLIGKAALVALISVGAGWTYLAVQGGLLGTDFYCLFFGYKPLAANKVVYYIPYILVWVVCFVVSSIGMNVERRLPSTGNEKKDTIIAVIFNGLLATATITIMVIVENAIQIHLGSSAISLATWKTDITRLWGMPAGMFIGGAGNTYLYRKTGNVWLGAILMGIICALGACLYGQVRFA